MRLTLIILTLLLFSGLIIFQFDQFRRGQTTVTASVGNLIGRDDRSGFAKAYEVRQFNFPQDLGAHPDYFLEWWYYTGNLQGDNGEEFGYQFTLFRRGLTPGEMTGRTSEWASNQVYFAHFTVTDVAGQTFEFHERFSRGSPELSGVQAKPYHVWLDDWDVQAVGTDMLGTTNLAQIPRQTRLQAKEGQIALDLMLEPTKPAALQGNNGLSQKSFEPGNASYYYSLTNNKTSGTMTTPRGTFQVTGNSWKDHEWSTSKLAAGGLGWDWFALKLDNQTEVMFYYIRLEGGKIEPASEGTLIDPAGRVRIIPQTAVKVTPLNYWNSPESGARYPIEWQFAIPSEGLDLKVTALLPNQELRVSTTYWEGAVKISGSHNGHGYVELTGYNESILSRLE